jgi:hypothetical protein
MSRPERLLLLVFFAALLLVLSRRELTPTVVGAVLGVVPALLLAGRLHRQSARMDRRLGTVSERPRGVRPRVVGVRAALHLLVLAGLLLTTLFVPFVGDELYAAGAAAVTAGAGVLTAARLRR